MIVVNNYAALYIKFKGESWNYVSSDDSIRLWMINHNQARMAQMANIYFKNRFGMTDSKDKCTLIQDSDYIEQANRERRIYKFIFNLRKKTSFGTVKRLLGQRYHIEISRGTPVVNRTYCQKSGNYHEEGILVVQGARSDLHAIKSDYDGGMSSKDLFAKYGEMWLRHERSLKRQGAAEKEEGAKTIMKEKFKEDNVQLKIWQQKLLTFSSIT